MFSYEEMEENLKNGKAILIKENQKPSKKNVRSKQVELNGAEFKLCTNCLQYQSISQFLFRKEGYYVSQCYSCERLRIHSKYVDDIAYYIKGRLYSLNQKMKNEKDKCTRQEFEKLFYQNKCSFTGRTLFEDWKEPHPNPNFRLTIDHIIPVSKGGTSNPSNLQVIPRAINSLKSDFDYEDFMETIEFLIDHYSESLKSDKR